MESTVNSVDKLLDIMKRLRSECPWDARQTHESLKPYLLEEAYEVLETIDKQEWDKLASELGDLLLQVVFHSQLGSEKGYFDFNDVVRLISEKLIERHPHVFGDKTVHSAEEVQNNWEHTKHAAENRSSILSGIPKFMPALLQAQRLQEKAATVGFEWDNIEQVIDKIEEELEEFKEAYHNNNKNELFDEYGDLLFSLVNLSRYLNINSEDSLRKTNNKFIRRFNYIEYQYNNNPAAMKLASLEELDNYWNEAKTAAAVNRQDYLISQLLHDTQSLLNLIKMSENQISDDLKKRIAYQEKVNKELLFYLREPELDISGMSVKNFITSSLELINLSAENIKTNIDKQITNISLDAELLSRAFNAIVSNAVWAVNNDSSKITISISPVSEFASELKYTHIQFIITDKGIGISKDFLPLVFDPFFTTRKQEGACGFGLSNAKKIIEKHGGKIKINSNKGEGTEVVFTISLRP
jgi:MazG family protein